MKKLNIEQLENVQGGTFWGQGNVHCNNTYTPEGMVLSSVRCYDYYIFWINAGRYCDYPVGYDACAY